LQQLLRVLLRVDVTARGVNVPLWVSAVAFIVLGALAKRSTLRLSARPT